MAQDSSIRLGFLDFQDIKASIQHFMSQQAEFTDHNFEGSALSQLINVLAYNSHYSALAGNFLANEVFLDTATMRSSIVSRSKELGYIPRSARAASTILNVTISGISNQSTTSVITLQAGAQFSTTVNATPYTFVSTSIATLPKTVVGGVTQYSASIPVYEGVLTQNTFNYNRANVTIAIPDVDIDTSTLVVKVYENGVWNEYTQPSTFLTVNSTSKVYMLQEGFNGFEIYFGDGILGYQPTDASSVQCTYVVTSGSPANGALNFLLTSAYPGQLSTTAVTIGANAAAGGGTEAETVQSIKLNAPNSFGMQNRCVVTADYETMVLNNFSTVKNIVAWDGADNVPPLFGHICLSIQPSVGDVLIPAYKDAISTFLASKSVGNIKVMFVDPQYVNLTVTSRIKYNSNSLTSNVFTLDSYIQSAILNYAAGVLQKFGGVFRFSPLCTAIDNADYSILGNDTTVGLTKYLTPNLYSLNSFNFTFGNNLSPGTITSTGWYDGINNNMLFLQDKNGFINSYYSLNGVNVLYQSNIGTIDYVTGKVTIDNLSIQSVNNTTFNINVTPASYDVYSSQNIILRLLQSDIVTTEVKDAI